MFDKIKASDGGEYTPDSVFTDDGGNLVGVLGQDATPDLSAREMQYSVEAVVREVMIPAYNSLVDALNALSAASDIGAEDIDGSISNVQDELEKRLITGNVKYIRLNSDRVLETSDDGVTWEATGSSGHIIVKPDGTTAPQRSRMKFANGTVTDDGTQTIITGLKGDKGDTGDTGPAGPRGIQGVQGLQGPAIVPTVSAEGVMSFSIQQTATIPQSVNVRGPQGVQGVQGPQGVPGPAGPQGVQGPIGPQGLRGDDGEDGRSFKVLSLYPTLFDLQTSHPTGESGDSYAVGTAANNEIYIWDVDSAEWKNIGALQGPRGPQGIQGVAGPQGMQGQQGIPGVNGKSAYTAARESGYGGTEEQFSAALSQAPSHLGSTSNPHSVTKAQVGLGNVDNVKQAPYTHVENTSNPHGVNKAQVGLGNVDNTSDANKPVSTAQQNALNGKADKSETVTAYLAAASWTGSAAPYAYSLSINGVTATSNQEIIPSLNITAEQLEALQAANIQDGGQSDGTITLKAYGDMPTVDIPIRVIMRGD